MQVQTSLETVDEYKVVEPSMDLVSILLATGRNIA